MAANLLHRIARWLFAAGSVPLAGLVLAALMLLAGRPAVAQELPIPALQARVTDTTGTLDAATVQALESQLADLEQRKGAQVAVLMIPTTGGESIEAYAVRAFEQWKLGRAKVDDGILLLVAKDDRALRIEVGYGLEGAVPDLIAGRIINEQIVPQFRNGDFAAGVVAGVNSLVARVNGEDLPAVETYDDDNQAAAVWAFYAFFVLLLITSGAAVMGALIGGLSALTMFGNAYIAVAMAVAIFFLARWAGKLRAAHAAKNPKRRCNGGWGGGGGFGGGGGGFGGGGGRSGGGGSSGRW